MSRAVLVAVLLITPALASAQSGRASALPDLVPRCAAQPSCASIMKPFEAKEVASLSDSARLVAAIMQASGSMASLLRDHDKQIAGAGYCFRMRTPGDSTIVAAAAAVMQERLPRLRGCRPDEAQPTVRGARRGGAVDPGTVMLALYFNNVTVSGDSATARFGVASGIYACELVRQAETWRVASCRNVGAS